MNDRAQIVDVMMRALCEHHHGQGSATCDEEQEGDSYVREEMNAILSGLEKVRVLLERVRAERLIAAAGCYLEVWRDECQGSGVPLEECAYGNAGVEPGDLDPLEGGE